MTIPLQNTIIYGPVKSRRLGSSLGVNLLSSQKKICNFNCVYCQYGWTTIKKRDLLIAGNFQDKNRVLKAVEKALIGLSPSPNYITFSGNGEATLHPEFNTIVDGIVRLRNEFAPNSKTVILSNSTGIGDKNTCNSLLKLDEVILKLDCSNEKQLKIYNRPIINIKLKEIVENLKNLENIIIQSLFTSGSHGNYNDQNISEWLRIVTDIKPKKVQIYSLDRGYPSEKISRVEYDDLELLKFQLNSAGIIAEVY